MKKTYNTLYSRDTLNKIRTWTVEQQDNRYRVKSGIKDSENQVVNDWTVVDDAKNSDDTIAQATKECLALIKKKLKTGYSESIDNVDTCLTYVEPMLAKHYKDYVSKIDFTKSNWGIQIKYNGNRCVATKNGLATRKGEKYISVPHIENALKPFFQLFPDAVLDGELFNYDLRQTLNELSKLVRKTVNVTAEDLHKSEKIVRFYIYDGYHIGGMNQSVAYSKRKSWIDTNVIGKYAYCNEVKTYPIKTVADKDKYFKKFIDDNEEGGILRDLDSGYENKRSNSLLKLKQECDGDCVILDVLEGSGNWSGTAKTATVRWGKIEFDCTFKGTYEDLVPVLKNKKDWIGKTVEFKYLELTGLGVPNSGRIDINNCIKTDR